MALPTPPITIVKSRFASRSAPVQMVAGRKKARAQKSVRHEERGAVRACADSTILFLKCACNGTFTSACVQVLGGLVAEVPSIATYPGGGIWFTCMEPCMCCARRQADVRCQTSALRHSSCRAVLLHATQRDMDAKNLRPRPAAALDES